MDDEMDDLPFDDASFDLVSAPAPDRDPVRRDRAGAACPAGRYISQEVGFGSMHELSDFMLGTSLTGTDRGPAAPTWSVRAAGDAGLEVVDLRPRRSETVFFDVAAVVHYLRKVVWIVPGFTVDAYRDRLRTVHDAGRFVAYSTRFLIEAVKPV